MSNGVNATLSGTLPADDDRFRAAGATMPSRGANDSNPRQCTRFVTTAGRLTRTAAAARSRAGSQARGCSAH